MLSIVIGGDVCPINRSRARFEAGDAAAIFTDLLDEIEGADLSVVNLECPLTKSPTPVDKVGPVLGAPPETVCGIRQAGIGVVGLANNHILDHGVEGLRSTAAACRDYGVETVGAGMDVEQAARPLILKAGGLRVAILAVAEHEFSVADESRAGANPLEVIRVVGALRAAGEEADVRIVLLHGGNEFYPYPSRRLQGVCRFLVEEGATAVICQHSHRAGCLERHGGGHIVYGQGNLVFDCHPNPRECWYEGFLVVLEVTAAGAAGLRVVPYRQFDEVAAVRRLRGEALAAFEAALKERSRNLADPERLDREWRRFCREQRDHYLGYLGGHPGWLRYLNARLGFLHHSYSARRKRLVRSVIQCESHREVLETVLAAGCGREGRE